MISALQVLKQYANSNRSVFGPVVNTKTWSMDLLLRNISPRNKVVSQLFSYYKFTFPTFKEILFSWTFPGQNDHFQEKSILDLKAINQDTCLT